jgi:hypothetical protein
MHILGSHLLPELLRLLDTVGKDHRLSLLDHEVDRLDCPRRLLGEDDAKALRVVHLIRNAVFPQVPDGEAGGDDGDRNEDADAEG